MRMTTVVNGNIKCNMWVRFSPLLLNKCIINKITGRDISTEYLALMSGLITSDEFELITLTIK